MEKKVIVICAISSNGVYGEDNTIPWYSKVDMDNFRENTTLQTVVMGRRTWESLPVKYRPLPKRDNTVITKSQDVVFNGALRCNSLDHAITLARTEKVFVIGGGSLWYQAMDVADSALITIIEKNFPVTEGVTHLAKDLLLPFETWPDFYLKESQDKRETIDGQNVTLRFHHWVR